MSSRHSPICHAHNLARPLPAERRYGIRVRLSATDPFRQLVGANWAKEHWFVSAADRDRALDEMSQRYVYFRPGDQPTLEFERIEKN